MIDSGSDWLQELNSSGASIKGFRWGLDVSGTRTGAGGVGGLLQVVLVDPADQVWHYDVPAFDANGNVAGLVNILNGAVTAEYDYDAFGRTILTRDYGTTAAAKNPFRFSTKYIDDETAMYYYGYRFYAPEIGRWPNRDPIEENGGLNFYSYVGNCVFNYYEYLGLGWLEVGISCAGHEDLLKNVTYFAEKEPPPEGSNDDEGPKIPRSPPAPGQRVQVDAVYIGNGAAVKLPTGRALMIISCKCDGDWRFEIDYYDGLHIPWADFDDFQFWIPSSPNYPGDHLPPKRWPNGDGYRKDGEYLYPPYKGTPPGGPPAPPLDPEPIPRRGYPIEWPKS